MKREKEECWMVRVDMDNGMERIWGEMRDWIESGIRRDGVMKGGLNVRRRERKLNEKIKEEWRKNRRKKMIENEWM